MFQSATGLFRRRGVAAPATEATARRREPETDAAAPVPVAAVTELAVDERPPMMRATSIDNGDLDIPAFLRRQSS